MQSWSDEAKGVEVRPTFGNQINICYSGLLSKSGADQVYLHCGYRDPDNWQESMTTNMDRTAKGWEKNVPMKNHTLAFCFKDSANNWDNNSGYNWIASV